MVLPTYGLLTVLGCLTSPLPSLGLGISSGVVAAAPVRLVRREFGSAARLLPHPAVLGISVASLPAALAGLTFLGADAGVLVTCLWLLPTAAVMAAVTWRSWTGGPGVPPRAAVDRDPGSTASDESLREVLRVLPADMLLADWQSTAARAAAEGADRLCRDRELLAELRRRVPEATGRRLIDEPDDRGQGDVRPDV